jgi:hypothetical protein
MAGVSVVIPSVGRDELRDAVRSARSQLGVDVETIVVFDLAESDAVGRGLPRLAEGADLVLFTGGARYAGAARNLGIRAATREFVALLDDDDEWAPAKLRTQLAALTAQNAGATVVSSRVRQGLRATKRLSDPTPSAVYSGGRIEDFLFRRRRPAIGRSGMYTSSLLLSTELARAVPWDETLRRHQDWDWLVRLQAAGAAFLQLPDSDVTIWAGSAGSISASNDWRSSLRWARNHVGAWEPSTMSDFLAGQPLRYALQAGSPRGVAACLRAIARTGRAPSPGPLALGLAGLIPRGVGLSALFRRSQPSRLPAPTPMRN